MRIQYFQHVPFETPAFLLDWAKKNNHSLNKTHLFASEDPMAAPDFDMLIVMGGPMNIYEYDQYPWLRKEKEAIKKAIDNNKYVLGICLGGQLIADVLGGKVTQNPQKEIGWMPVIQTPEILVRSPFSVLPKEYVAFHWHGDTFAIPPGAVRQCSSAACVNQGFLYKEKVIGFQYHIEATEQSVSGLVKNCANELVEAPYIHSAEKIMQDTAKYQKTANGLIEKMLEAWLA